MLVTPADDVQAAIARSGYGDSIVLSPGVYSLAAGLQFGPGQKLIGNPGVVLHGGGKTECAIVGTGAPGLEIHGDGMIVERFSPLQQHGAVGDWNPNDASFMLDWLVEQVEIRFCAWRGCCAGTKTRIVGCKIHHCGDLGIGGSGYQIQVQGCELAFNNTAGNAVGWEAGGAKFTSCENLTLGSNWVHDNNGPGLWMDIECRWVLVEGNLVENNSAGGISHEIGYQAKIRRNTCRNNAGDSGPWWGGQITVSTSEDVEIYCNTIQTLPGIGNGIQVIQQLRPSQTGGSQNYLTRNVRVHHNDITFTGVHGCAALLSDEQDMSLVQAFLAKQGNLYDWNAYHVIDPAGWHWAIGGPNPGLQWSGWQAAGMDTHGTVGA